MVSEYVSSVAVYFNGQPGYLNLIGYLNTIANQYQNSSYTLGARHIGYSNQTKYITDTSKITNPAPWANSTGSNTVEIQGGGDYGYISDLELVNKAVGHIQAYRVGTITLSSYWLASRLYSYFSTDYRFNARYVYTGGDVNNYDLYYYWGGWGTNSFSSGVRPILTLKSGLTYSTGDGTSSSPYVLN